MRLPLLPSKAGPSPGPTAGTVRSRSAELLRFIAFGVVVALLVVGGIALWRYLYPTKQPTPASTERLATAADQENRYSNVINQSLKDGDISNYQLAKLELANAYIVDKDYTSASRILSNVLKNVPADKLVPYTYQLLIQVAQHNKDQTAEKTYLQKIIPLLKAQQRNEEAAGYQKQLDGLG